MKKMSKRLLAVLLSLLMLCSVAPLSALAESAVPVEWMHLPAEGFTLITGQESDSLDMYIRYLPYDTTDDITYTVADESVVKVMTDDIFGAYLLALKAGTTTLTATAESGVTASTTVTVMDPIGVPFAPGDTATVVVNTQFPTRYLIFTVPENGWYEIASQCEDYDPYLYIYDSEWNFFDSADDTDEGYNFQYVGEFDKDVTYYLELGCYDVAALYTVTATKTTEPDGSGDDGGDDYAPVKGNVFSLDEITVSVNDTLYPQGMIECNMDVNDSFICADETVLSLDALDYIIYLKGLKPGTTTLSYLCGDEVYDTMTVHVTNAKVLTLDAPLTMEIREDYHEAVASFIPAADGQYVFICEDVSLYLTDAEGKDVEPDSDTLGQYIYTLTGGKTYFASVSYYEEFTTDLVVSTPKKATGMVLGIYGIPFEEDTITTAAGLPLPITPIFSPVGAAVEDCTYELSKTGVLTEVDPGYFVAVALGEVTVTVTSESGLSATITVQVVDDITGGIYDFDGSGLFDIDDVHLAALALQLLGDLPELEINGDNKVDLWDIRALLELLPDAPAFVPGKVDDDDAVTVSDALNTLQIVTGKLEATALQLVGADVDGSGGITVSDALLLLQKVTGKVSSFPVEGMTVPTQPEGAIPMPPPSTTPDTPDVPPVDPPVVEPGIGAGDGVDDTLPEE